MKLSRRGKPKARWIVIGLLIGLPGMAQDIPEPELSPEEQELLQQEFSPPPEAPFTTEIDPITAEPVAIPKANINQNAPVTIAPESNEAATYSQEGLKRVTTKGEYIYDVRNTPQSYGGGLRFGSFLAPMLKNRVDGRDIFFDDIYGSQAQLMINLDFEWQFLRTVGKLGVRAGTGLLTAKGNGRFGRDPAIVAREVYTFFLAPNSASLIYRAQYGDRQIFVPYGYAGAYYFSFLESRDDNAPFKYGGAPAAMFGGGIQFGLDSLDRKAINEMDREYGVNHVWLIADYQQIVGLSQKFDFSTSYISAGVLVEF